MSKNDILKLTIIIAIVVCTIVLILLVFCKQYLISKAAATNPTGTLVGNLDKTEENTNEPTDAPTVEPTDTPEETPLPTITPATENPNSPINYGPDAYYVKVNNQMNTVTIYEKDASGQAGTPIKAMICSGRRCNPTKRKICIKQKKVGVETTIWKCIRTIYNTHKFRYTIPFSTICKRK